MASRRTLLKGAGAISVLLVGGAVWRAYDSGVFSAGKGPAYEPWRDWRSGATETPLALVRAGILAANPHNTQPWLFKVTDTRIELYADTARNLGAFDPYLREMHIGLGCAVENMALAATANGYVAGVSLVPGWLGPIPERPERVLVATLDLSKAPKQRSELYDAIPRRHTNRAAYAAARALPLGLLASIRGMTEGDAQLQVFLFTTSDTKAKLGELVIKATETIIADKPMVQDSERWFRHRWEEVQTARDGPTLDATGMSPLMTAIAKVLPRPSPETSHRYWLDATRNVHVPETTAFGLIAVRDLYDRPQAMRAGRAWQRMHLFATANGIAMQPINQPVELVDRERQLSKEPWMERALATLTGDASWKPTFAFRMGYPTREVPPSPRRSVEAVVL